MEFSPFTVFHFVGVAGTGMSALAQYLAQRGFTVTGSDRQFLTSGTRIESQLRAEGIECKPQDGSAITAQTSFVVVSTAIETSNPDLAKAQELGVPTLHRSELLAKLTSERKTIAISGTSGKSTVTGMVYHILEYAGLQPSLLSGAGLSSLEAQGKIGNAVAGMGEWLVCEADESDGTLVRYYPEIGVILNIDKDHKEISELKPLFQTFAQQTKSVLVVNGDHPVAKEFSREHAWEFGHEGWQGFQGIDFAAQGHGITFRIRHFGQLVKFTLPVPGRHNMENAQAACACAVACGVSLRQCSEALSSWGGIHRRHQILGTVQGITLVDDFAHNPAKIAASILACKAFTQGRVLAWYQPHGFAPTKFMREELVSELARVLGPEDQILFSRIYYAGGTAQQDISSADLVADLKPKGVRAYYLEDREVAADTLIKEAFPQDTILLMGARDPSLGDFAQKTFQKLQKSLRCV